MRGERVCEVWWNKGVEKGVAEEEKVGVNGEAGETEM